MLLEVRLKSTKFSCLRSIVFFYLTTEIWKFLGLPTQSPHPHAGTYRVLGSTKSSKSQQRCINIWILKFAIMLYDERSNRTKMRTKMPISEVVLPVEVVLVAPPKVSTGSERGSCSLAGLHDIIKNGIKSFSRHT